MSFDEEEADNFDRAAAEQKEIDILLDKGFEFNVGKKKYLIKQPFLGTLDYLADQFIKLDFNIAELESGSNLRVFEEQKKLVKPNNWLSAKIIAIAYLNSLWKITFLTPFYTMYFRWSITPSDLNKLTGIVLRASNLGDFTSSIVLMSVNRTTAPQAIED